MQSLILSTVPWLSTTSNKTGRNGFITNLTLLITAISENRMTWFIFFQINSDMKVENPKP